MDGQRKMFRMAERKEGVSMNEVFKKIIEKLEDERKTAEQLIMKNPQDELDRIQTQIAEDFALAHHEAIEIVKQEAEQYNKAIDDLLEDANEMAIEVDAGTYTMKAIGIGLLEQIAEQLKVGGTNE